MPSSVYREIEGVSGLKPDSGTRRKRTPCSVFGRRSFAPCLRLGVRSWPSGDGGPGNSFENFDSSDNADSERPSCELDTRLRPARRSLLLAACNPGYGRRRRERGHACPLLLGAATPSAETVDSASGRRPERFALPWVVHSVARLVLVLLLPRGSTPAQRTREQACMDAEATPDQQPGTDRERTELYLAELSNAMVGVYKDIFGRGPSKCRTSYAGPDLIVSSLEHSLTRPEQRMAEAGDHRQLRKPADLLSVPVRGRVRRSGRADYRAHGSRLRLRDRHQGGHLDRSVRPRTGRLATLAVKETTRP